MAAAAILDFQEFEILTIDPLHEANIRHTVPNLIKIGQTVQRYGDLTVFKMAAVRHLGFVKFEFF